MLTQEYLESLVAHEQYHRFPGTTVTVCCLTLCNGMAVVGESACLPTTEFDKATGQKYARKKALDKIWDLEGYLARQMLWMAQDPEVQAAVAKLEGIAALPVPTIVLPGQA